MAEARQKIIETQNQFYRNAYRQIVMLIFALMIIAFALLGLVIYQHVTRPTSQYFVTTSGGRLIEIAPVAP